MTGAANRPAVVVVLIIFMVAGAIILCGWQFTGAVRRANKVPLWL